MPLQDWIHHWEVGAGSRIIKGIAVVLAFVAVAGLYDLRVYKGFSSEEAMEMAQLGRNISGGAGFTTKTIRPLSIYLLGGKELRNPLPDVTNPPAYPVLLAALMKLAPMHFTATQNWDYQPERLITVFNQALFFAALLLLFGIARKQFDNRVAWLAAVLFGATELYWKVSASGLSTMWVIVVFLTMIWCLAKIADASAEAPASVGWSALVGALIGIGGLSRYSFAWIILPTLLFLALGTGRKRGINCAAAAFCFLFVMGPWIARNAALTSTPFGTASYDLIQGTAPLELDAIERSLDPRGALHRVEVVDVCDKLLSNTRDLCRSVLAGFGGNWITSFFLVGLLIPFQSAARGRLRQFFVGSLILVIIVQALGQTHLTNDSHEISTDNLVAILAPMAFIYGAALFYTLMDQLNLLTMDARGAVVGIFLIVMSAPLLLSVLAPSPPPANSPYSPLHIQRVSHLMQEGELMMSDIPAAVAWYGNQDCSWLTLDDERDFLKISELRRVNAVFLTQHTTDGRFLTQMASNPKSWGYLFADCEAHLAVDGHGEVPSGFPLTNAPSGFLPDQILLSDRIRWAPRPSVEK